MKFNIYKKNIVKNIKKFFMDYDEQYINHFTKNILISNFIMFITLLINTKLAFIFLFIEFIFCVSFFLFYNLFIKKFGKY